MRESLIVMVEAVKAHALENYGVLAWDEIVEAWDSQDIAANVMNCESVNEAIMSMTRYVEMKYSYMEDIRNA